MLQHSARLSCRALERAVRLDGNNTESLNRLGVAYARAGFGVAPNPRQRRFLHRSPEDVLAAVARLQARLGRLQRSYG